MSKKANSGDKIICPWAFMGIYNFDKFKPCPKNLH